MRGSFRLTRNACQSEFFTELVQPKTVLDAIKTGFSTDLQIFFLFLLFPPLKCLKKYTFSGLKFSIGTFFFFAINTTV